MNSHQQPCGGTVCNSGDVCLSNLEDVAVTSVFGMLEIVQDLVDGKFGTGFAAKHPTILAGLVQACATFYAAERLSGPTTLADYAATIADRMSARNDAEVNAGTAPTPDRVSHGELL